MTDITIAAGGFPHYNGPSTGEIWIVANKAYTTPEGKIISQGSVQDGIFVAKAPFTVDGSGTLQVGAMVADATVNAIDHPDATLMTYVVCTNSRGNKLVTNLGTFQNFRLDHIATSTTWAEIAAYNVSTIPEVVPHSAHITGVMEADGGFVGDILGDTTVGGELTVVGGYNGSLAGAVNVPSGIVTPNTLDNPTGSVGLNADTTGGGTGLASLSTRGAMRLYAENNGFIAVPGPLSGTNLAAVITAIGSAQETLEINTPQSIAADLVIPPNVTLIWGRKGSINQGAHTLTIQGPMPNAPERQLFFGTGTISFFGNDTLEFITPSWWFTNTTPGTTDAAPAMQKAIDAAIAMAPFGSPIPTGRGITIRTPASAVYAWYSTPTLIVPANIDLVWPIRISGYGTRIIMKMASTPGLAVSNTGPHTFGHLIIEGITFQGMGTESDVIRILTSGTANIIHFALRDIKIIGSTGHGIHIDCSGSAGGTGAFEFQIADCTIDLGSSNTTKFGIYLDGPASTISSAELLHNNLGHGLNNIRGISQSAQIIGGTYLSAYEEGLYLFLQSGLLSGPHVENSWQSVAGSPFTGGGQIYIEGWADVIGLEEHRDPSEGLAQWELDLHCYSGPTNIIGRRKTVAGQKYARVRNSSSPGGSIKFDGLEPSQVDTTAVVSYDNPYLIYIGSPTDTVLQGSGGVRLSTLGLLTQNTGATLSIVSNTIAPTFPIHHISNSGGLLQTMTPPPGFISGTVTLIAGTTPFTVGTAGNFSRALTGLVAGQSVMFTFSAADGKWHF